MPRHLRRATLLAVPLALLLVRAVSAQAPLREAHPGDDFTVREEMVPMRDGVKLYTLIITPKGAGPLPILLQRTPYDASGRSRWSTSRLAVAMGHLMLGGGYIFVVQDLRGRFRSEGDYAMYRVPRGAYNRTTTDETTDAWDTIDWLVKNVPANNGKVGVWGTSYPGGSRSRRCATRTRRWRRPSVQPRRGRVESRRLVPLGRLPRRVRVRLHLLDGDRARAHRRLPV